jgi:ABC-type phosphate transport system auxiliary subunit
MSGLREMVDVFYEHVSSDDFEERCIEQGIRAIIETLATEAERDTPTYHDVTGAEVQFKLADWLRSHLPNDTEATG